MSDGEMSQLFIVLSPPLLTPPPLVAAPLATVTYLMELRSTRKPRMLIRNSGEDLPRYAERQYPA